MSGQPEPGKAGPQVATVTDVVEVITTCCIGWGGQPRWLRGGDVDFADGVPPIRNRVLGMLFSDSHPLVKSRPDLFRPLALRLEQLPD